MNYSLLPPNKTYADLIYPFFIPYALYVGLGVIAEYIPLWFLYFLKLFLTGAALFYYKKYYSLGKWSWKSILISIITTPIWVILWIIPIWSILTFFNAPFPQKLASIPHSEIYWWLHLSSSTIVVPIFEELVCRVYLLEYLYQSNQKQMKATINNLNKTIDQNPQKLTQLPFCFFSVFATLLFFIFGHGYVEYASCCLYFVGTCILYYYTRSFLTCVLTHAFTNLTIALLVRFAQMEFLWF